MSNSARAIEEGLSKAAGRLDLASAVKPRGVVRRVGDGVAHVAGLDEVGYEELLQFDSGALGMAYDLAEESTRLILLTHAEHDREGDGVRGEQRRTQRGQRTRRCGTRQGHGQGARAPREARGAV